MAGCRCAASLERSFSVSFCFRRLWQQRSLRTQIAGSEGAYGRGTAAFEQKDYVTAEKDLALAVQSGGLQPISRRWLSEPVQDV